MDGTGKAARRGGVGRRGVLGVLAVPAVTRLVPAHAAPRAISVVTTFSILQDIVTSICGEDAAVHSLVGPNRDTHGFQARPSDAQAVRAATILVSNGLGLEAWLPRLVEAAGFSGRHVVASAGIVPLMRTLKPGGAAAVPDPHCWQDVGCARHYAANIVDGLNAVDPANAERCAERAAALDKRLAALDGWIRGEIDSVPQGQRRVITDHDAFAYFAKAYGVEFLSLRGRLPESEAPARRMAELVAMLREHRVRALFIENMTNPALIEQVARDGGAVVGRELYSDALSLPDGPAATYEAMMRHNVTALVAGMRQY